MIKKILLITLLLFLALVAAFFIWRWINYSNDPDPYKTFLLPKVEMSVVEINSISAEKSEVTSNLLVKNQFPFRFTADSFEYRLYINDALISKTRYKKSITLEPNDSSWITLPLAVYIHDLDSLIDANEQRKIDSVEYRLYTSFYTHIPFRKNFDITVKRFLPLIHIPKVEVVHLEVDSLNLSRASLVVQTVIENGNVFPIKVKEIKYEFRIQENEWVEGVIPGLTVIREKGTTLLELPVRISFKEVSKTLFDLLKKGRNVGYDLKLNFRLKSDLNSMDNATVIVKNSGSVKSLLKARKEIKEVINN